MENAVDATLVTDIAGDVLAELAPQELPILPAASRAHFADPAATLKRLHPKDNALGFGVDPTVAFLTPIVLQILSDVFDFLTGVAKKSVEAGLAKEIPEIIKGMFRKFHSSQLDAPAVLTREQIALIHGDVLAAAKRLRMPPDKAQSLADAVTARLVMPKG
jgi:hypothetical protein